MKVGTFLCKVLAPSNGWFGEAGSNNTPFIRLPLVVTQEGSCEGEHVTFQAWLTDKSADRNIKNLREVFGWDGDLVALAGMATTGPFVGKACQIVTEEEEHKGQMRVIIKWLNAPGSGGKMMDAQRALDLARRLSGQSRPTSRPSTDPDLDAPRDNLPF